MLLPLLGSQCGGIEHGLGFVITVVTGFKFLSIILCFRWGLVCQRAFLSDTTAPSALGLPWIPVPQKGSAFLLWAPIEDYCCLFLCAC